MSNVVNPFAPKADPGEELIKQLLTELGENPDREGLQETPKRVMKAWRHWTNGYALEAADVLKTFEDGAEGADEMVIVRDIQLYSHCEHHMAPFFGKAHVGYIPNGRVVGLSKLARVVDIFSHRLQVQERLTNQIANAINDELQPLGVAVVIEATHFCMCSRGVNKQGSTTVTSALRGAIKDKPEARAEFMALAGLR
jgi:GTP cyclohydrolase I